MTDRTNTTPAEKIEELRNLVRLAKEAADLVDWTTGESSTQAEIGAAALTAVTRYLNAKSATVNECSAEPSSKIVTDDQLSSLTDRRDALDAKVKRVIEFAVLEFGKHSLPDVYDELQAWLIRLFVDLPVNDLRKSNELKLKAAGLL